MRAASPVALVAAVCVSLWTATQVIAQQGVAGVPEGFAPAVVQVHELGQIDWTTGEAVTTAQAAIRAPDTPENRAKVARLARDKAYAKAVKLLSDVQVDALETFWQVSVRSDDVCVKRFVARFPIAAYKHWIVCTTYVYCNATVRLPFYGVKGLSVHVHDFAAKTKLAKEVREKSWRRQAPDAGVGEPLPIVIIDTTGLGIEQAIYPKIVDQSGQALLSVDSRDQNVLAYEGMVTYVTRAAPGAVPCMPAPALGRHGLPWEARRWGALAYLETDGLAGQGLLAAAGVVPGASRGVLFAAAPRQRIRRRRITVKAASTSKVDVVLSAAAAKKLTSNPQAAEALKKGRVYIVVDSRKAAIQGRGPARQRRHWDLAWRTTARHP